MKSLMAAVILSVTALFLATGSTNTLAQVKKPGKGTIELIESKDGKFRFNVRDEEGKYVGGSAIGHATEKEAREAAETLKKVMATATYVTKKADVKKTDAKDK